MTEQEKRILEEYLNSIYNLLDKLPNRNIEGSTESKILVILEQINCDFDIAYIGKYL